MKFILERPSEDFENIQKAIRSLYLDVLDNCSCYGHIKYTYDMILESPYSQYFPFGSVSMMLLCKDLGMEVFFDEANFTYTKFADSYKEHFLNPDIEVIKFSELLELGQYSYFVRQNAGANLIKGAVYHDLELTQLYNTYIGKTIYEERITDNTEMIIGFPHYNILTESRYFIVKGEIISGSQYSYFGQYELFNLDNWATNRPKETNEYRFVKEMIDLYCPVESFVMDIATLSDGTYRVIECNCVNSSGFYACNIESVLQAIHENYG
jgi:hypothetical protein